MIALAFLLSLPNAAVWIFYIRAVHSKNALHTALWDGAIVLLSNVSILTIWHASGHDVMVLLGYLFGGMVGSYVTVKLTAEPTKNLPYCQQQTDYTCGPAALRSLLAGVGIHASEEELSRRSGCTFKDGTHPQGLVAAAESFGLGVAARPGWTLGELESSTPVLTCIQAQGTQEEYDADESGHYVVVQMVRNGVVHYLDPSEGETSLRAQDFVSRWHDKETDGSITVRWGMTITSR